jgi:bacillithiol system protein YtxJ
MNWITLNSLEQLELIKEKSTTTPQIIFKHSTRCSISSMALSRLERADTVPAADFYYLDLIANRNISNSIAEIFDVYHQSPQILLIKNGECIYDESHSGISMDEISDQVSQLN